jgi:hypothetical protein
VPQSLSEREIFCPVIPASLNGGPDHYLDTVSGNAVVQSVTPFIKPFRSAPSVHGVVWVGVAAPHFLGDLLICQGS